MSVKVVAPDQVTFFPFLLATTPMSRLSIVKQNVEIYVWKWRIIVMNSVRDRIKSVIFNVIRGQLATFYCVLSGEYRCFNDQSLSQWFTVSVNGCYLWSIVWWTIVFYRRPLIVYFCVFLVYQDTVYKVESQKEEESPIRR